MSISTAAQKIRVGLIGVGTWAEYGHIPSLKLLPEYAITAVYSRSQAKAEEVARKHDIPYALSDIDALVNHPEVDLVLVLNPAPQHAASIEKVIAAGKHVYAEWPLTPSTARSRELLLKANQAGVRHLVGLQRRLAPDYRFIHDLIADDYLGELRSVRLHISVEYFKQLRIPSLYYTVPKENFSSLLSIYGGHYLDVLFTTFGLPRDVSALLVNQFKTVTLIGTDQPLPHSSADQVVLSGQFENGALYTVHLEAGKANNYGLQLDITGSRGDLKISNSTSFGDNFALIQGAQGEDQPLTTLRIPEKYHGLPANGLGASVLELTHLYAAFARDLNSGSQDAPTFADALAMHEWMDGIELSSKTGSRVSLL